MMSESAETNPATEAASPGESASESPLTAATQSPPSVIPAPAQPSRLPPWPWLCWLLGYALLAGAGYWRITQPDYRLAAGMAALEREALDEVRGEAANLLRHPKSAAMGQLLECGLLIRKAGDSGLSPEDTGTAKDLFEAAQQDESIRPLAKAWEGHFRILMGDQQGALQALLNSRELDPSRPESYRYLGLLSFQAQAYPQALDVLAQAINMSPHDSRLHALRGEALRAQRSFAEAAKAYRESLRLYPAQPGCQLALAQSLVELGDHAAALAELDLLEPSASVDFVRARCLFAGSVPATAREPINRALRESPQDLEILALKAEIEMAAGDPAAAAEALSKVVESLPFRPEPREKLAEAQAAAGQPELADEQRAKAAELSLKWKKIQELEAERQQNPSDAGAAYALGAALLELELKSEAASLFEMAVTLDPKHAEARQALESLGAATPSPQVSPPK